MKKENKNKPLDAMEYPRFEGIRTFMRLPHETNLKEIDITSTLVNENFPSYFFYKGKKFIKKNFLI